MREEWCKLCPDTCIHIVTSCGFLIHSSAGAVSFIWALPSPLIWSQYQTPEAEEVHFGWRFQAQQVAGQVKRVVLSLLWIKVTFIYEAHRTMQILTFAANTHRRLSPAQEPSQSAGKKQIGIDSSEFLMSPSINYLLESKESSETCQKRHTADDKVLSAHKFPLHQRRKW